MLMLPSRIILPCLLRFSSTVISVGSGFAFGSGSTFVLLIKSTGNQRQRVYQGFDVFVPDCRLGEIRQTFSVDE